jgi:hypothetical protein
MTARPSRISVRERRKHDEQPEARLAARTGGHALRLAAEQVLRRHPQASDPKRRPRRGAFSFDAKRRREIECHARHVGAAHTGDFDRWLIAWAWHNSKSNDPMWALQNAARRMGGGLSDAEALRVLEEADLGRHWKADSVARFLGVTYRQRTLLGLTTIGACDFSRRRRKLQRKHKDRMHQERKRRERGARPQSQSLSQTRPWEAMNMSRRTWERHRNKARDATSSAACFISPADKSASTEGVEGVRAAATPPKEVRGLPSSQTATTMAADSAASSYSGLPLELRLIALGLVASKNAPKIGIAA